MMRIQMISLLLLGLVFSAIAQNKYGLKATGYPEYVESLWENTTPVLPKAETSPP